MNDKVEKNEPKNPRNAAYAEALKGLRLAHADEFDMLYKEACEQRGIAYKKRLTPEEKAEKALVEKRAKAVAKAEALKAEFPDLFA